MRSEVSEVVDAPPEAVWPWLVEPDRMKRWMKGLLEVERRSGDGAAAGACYRWRIQEGPRKTDYDVEIAACDAPRHVAWRIRAASGRGPAYAADHRLEPLEGGRTRATYGMEVEAGGLLLKVLAPLLDRFNRRQARSFLASLKRQAEAESGA